MNTLKLLATVAACAAVTSMLPVSAQTIGLAKSAIDHHNGVSLHNWRFDRISTVDGKQWRERCVGIDFHKAECRLLNVDDEPADAKAQKKYAKEMPQPVEDNLPNLDPTDFINMATLALTQKDVDAVGFTFDASADSPEDYDKEGRMRGSMLVDREGGYIRSLNMANSETFKPVTGVKIKQVNVDVQFLSIQEQVFAKRVAMSMKGRAFGLKKLDENKVVAFENFTPPQ